MDYESYILAEWRGFLEDPTRARASRDVVAGRRVERVLDVGCGGGQELLPFAALGAFCVGVDIAPQVGRAPWRPEHGTVTFARGDGAAIPFPDQSFDVVVCRGALSYMDARIALSEMARVLRRDGLLLLKLVTAPCYLRELGWGVSRRDGGQFAHAVRALVAGVWYHVFDGRLPAALTRAAFQTEWMTRRELDRAGLRIERRMPDSRAIGPSFAVVRR